MARVALIIGQTDNVCEAICIKFMALQYRVIVLLDADVRRQSEWLALMKDGGCDVKICSSDGGSSEGMAHRVAEIEQETGAIDVLVLAQSKNDPDESLFVITRKIAKDMSTRDYGRIVLIDFLQNRDAQEKESHPFSESRAAFTQDFVKVLLPEIAGRNVTINTVTAGRIMENSAPAADQIQENGTELKPANEHLNQQQEIAGLVAYLVSDEATFISGANIAVNSGSYLR